MRQRLAALKRLTALYQGIEEMQFINLQRTIAAVREAEQAMDMQHAALRSSDADGREALASGDCMSWNAAKTQRVVAEWKQARLEQIRLERELSTEVAKKQYIASRLQSAQMKHLSDDVATRVEVEAERRMQSGLDDRFLARRRWIDTREELRRITEMNVS